MVPDLVLLDVMMPGIDGYEVCRRIKKQPEFSELPVIFLTAMGEMGHLVKGFEAGAVDYIPKPFSLKELELRVLTHLKLRRAMLEMQRMAVTDGLTGLFNHRFIVDSLNSRIKEAQRYAQPLSLIMLDIDYFKSINDSFGHQTGDLVLEGVASKIKECLRKVDLCGRYGGEEFLVILPNTALEGGLQVAEKIRETVQTANWGVQGLQAAISGGVAQMGKETSSELLSRADQQLYHAKDQGRNRICF